jgi:hypothetical protein
MLCVHACRTEKVHDWLQCSPSMSWSGKGTPPRLRNFLGKRGGVRVCHPELEDRRSRRKGATKESTRATSDVNAAMGRTCREASGGGARSIVQV